MPEDGGSGDSEEACAVLTLLEGGSWASSAWCADLEMEGDRREELGRWIPSDGRDNDLRRVLYGMMDWRREREENKRDEE